MKIQDGNHNWTYYTRLLSFLDKTKQRNEDRQKHSDIFKMGKIVGPVSGFVAEALMTPVISTYSFFGKTAVWVAGHFSREKALSLQNFWEDPLPTSTLIKIATYLRDKSRPIAISKPTTQQTLGYFHTSWISLCQHIHIISKDAVDVFNVPKALRESLSPKEKKKLKHNDSELGPGTVNENFKLEEKKEPSTFSELVIYGVKRTIQILKQSLYYLIDTVTRVVKKVFNIQSTETTPTETPPVSSPKKKKSWWQRAAKNLIVNPLRKKAIKMIDASEDKYRKKAVFALGRKATFHTIKFVVSAGLRGAIGACGYFMARKAFTYWTGHHDFPPEAVRAATIGVNTLGAYFWYRCLTPVFQNLYEDYNPNYDPDASTALEIKKILTFKNVGPMYNFLKNRYLYRPEEKIHSLPR